MPSSIIPNRFGCRSLLFVSAIGALNVVVGLLMSLDAAHMHDFQTVREWARVWLLDGVNLYAAPGVTDYPPHALVLYAPLIALPMPLVFAAWSLLNVCFAVAAPSLAVRLLPTRRSATEVAWLTALFMCWSGSKVFAQFTLLSLVCSLLSLSVGLATPARGLLLSAALAKPQVALPFVLCLIVGRTWRVLAAAVTAVVAGTLVYCARAGVWPQTIALDYLRILQGLHTGDAAMAGASELRPLFASISAAATADLLAGVVGVLLLAAALVIGLRMRDRTLGALTSLALGGAVPLLAVYHITYGFVLLLPMMMLLFMVDDETTFRVRRVSFVVLQLGLMFDVPGIWRRSGLAEHGPVALAAVASHADRLLISAAFVVTAVVMRRIDQSTTQANRPAARTNPPVEYSTR